MIAFLIFVESSSVRLRLFRYSCQILTYINETVEGERAIGRRYVVLTVAN